MNTKYEIGCECSLGLISAVWWDMRKKHGKEEQMNHVRNRPGFETTEGIQRILRVLSASFLTHSQLLTVLTNSRGDKVRVRNVEFHEGILRRAPISNNKRQWM